MSVQFSSVESGQINAIYLQLRQRSTILGSIQHKTNNIFHFQFVLLQVKIWFQNRRAKERKQTKKRLQQQGQSTESDHADNSDVEQDEDHHDITATPTKQQQQRLISSAAADGDDILRSACVQSIIKTEAPSEGELSSHQHKVMTSSPVKNMELINVLRHGHLHHAST